MLYLLGSGFTYLLGFLLSLFMSILAIGIAVLAGTILFHQDEENKSYPFLILLSLVMSIWLIIEVVDGKIIFAMLLSVGTLVSLLLLFPFSSMFVEVNKPNGLKKDNLILQLFIVAVFAISLFVFVGFAECDEYIEKHIGKQNLKTTFFKINFFNKEDEVINFLKTINPELKLKIKNIENEITLSTNKIEKLREIREKFPNQQSLIDNAINQWNNLNKELMIVNRSIYEEVEKSYVIYQINKIEGNKRFNTQSKKLLEKANKVLKDAKYTKETIERSLYNE